MKTQCIKNKRTKKNTLCNTNQKKVGGGYNNIKVHFKAKSITRNKEQDFILIKQEIYQEDKTNLNTYALSHKVRKYLK